MFRMLTQMNQANYFLTNKKRRQVIVDALAEVFDYPNRNRRVIVKDYMFHVPVTSYISGRYDLPLIKQCEKEKNH